MRHRPGHTTSRRYHRTCGWHRVMVRLRHRRDTVSTISRVVIGRWGIGTVDVLGLLISRSSSSVRWLRLSVVLGVILLVVLLDFCSIDRRVGWGSGCSGGSCCCSSLL